MSLTTKKSKRFFLSKENLEVLSSLLNSRGIETTIDTGIKKTKFITVFLYNLPDFLVKSQVKREVFSIWFLRREIVDRILEQIGDTKKLILNSAIVTVRLGKKVNLYITVEYS